MWIPTPAAVGENVLLLTPGPLNVPPEGLAPSVLRLMGVEPVQADWLAGHVTFGILVTVIWKEQELVQLFALV